MSSAMCRMDCRSTDGLQKCKSGCEGQLKGKTHFRYFKKWLTHLLRFIPSVSINVSGKQSLKEMRIVKNC